MPVGQWLTREEAALAAGVKAATWSSYVSRGVAPRPGRMIARTPLGALPT